MLATKKQINYIQTHNKHRREIPVSVFTMFSNLSKTKKITIVSFEASKNNKPHDNNFSFALRFACTKQGFEYLNEAINLVFAIAATDKNILFDKKHHVYDFLIPPEFANSGVKELEKCKCVQLVVYTQDVTSRVKVLGLITKQTKYFI